jgi:hypothetical protein
MGILMPWQPQAWLHPGLEHPSAFESWMSQRDPRQISVIIVVSFMTTLIDAKALNTPPSTCYSLAR